ncbi:hypothetical protein ANCDUO_23207 [Ancylostoma duodenale]|uniref:Galactose-1-phosphate uridyl transferase N-terminal domain-containing protein n=1 Tax=Ancylostoma duodenale TaxID=51022 RepID=A0A0C2BS95_9BILA|nr:hypothetical protein ANCDUO_23207 [Ancylostoma duodenale]
MSKKNNHRRYNPLLDEWVIVAENRVSRPWQGAKTDPPSFSATTGINSLAPGGKRFNDVIVMLMLIFPEDNELFRQMEVRGVCRVICYHPDTKQSIATMSQEEAFIYSS